MIQRQILDFFRGNPLTYTADQLNEIQVELEEPIQRANFSSRECKKYWLLRYLEQRAKDNPFIWGTVVRSDAKVTLVEIDELFITLAARIDKPKLGGRVELKIITVDPRADFVRVEVKRKGR